jgi:hypothetical protein
MHEGKSYFSAQAGNERDITVLSFYDNIVFARLQEVFRTVVCLVGCIE